MRALLLAAGMGTRLRPLTLSVPKCLVAVHGRPLLDYWLDLLFGAGIDRAAVNCHWLAERVVAHVGASPWRDRVDLVHETELLGTGGTILANRQWLAGGPFLVAHADNLTDFNVAALIAAHSSRPIGCAITMLAFRTDDPRSCGILELDHRGVVQAFHEKVESPPGDLANAAVYIMEPEVIDFIAAKGRPVVDLSTEVLPHYIGRIAAVVTKGYHRDIGTLESLARANREFTPPQLSR
ncbi:MAG TPA: nucleotidyltransferase family protein [Hyphomicrobiaceae bacterium]|nr:nucleotidyltransferase family protein [Hyphomicrobiaceae bacterium]